MASPVGRSTAEGVSRPRGQSLLLLSEVRGELPQAERLVHAYPGDIDRVRAAGLDVEAGQLRGNCRVQRPTLGAARIPSLLFENRRLLAEGREGHLRASALDALAGARGGEVN